MNTTLRRGWRLAAAALIGAGALLAGCGSTPVAPKEITLAGVVVDGQRLARADESGLVGVYRNGAWVEGKAEMTLQVGDTVSTGPNAYALIRYPSGSELYLRPNTRGQVGSFTDMVGEVFAKIRGAFAIQTSFVKAGADGTAYSVRSTPDGEYAVVVLDGTVRLSSLRAAWPAIALGPGTMGAGRPQVPPTAMPATAQELARTRAWVERMEQLLPPPSRYPGAGAALAVAGLVAIIAASSHDGGSGGL
ncbi:MAG TPA: FecR family protein, partial [Albitalea sp.]|nr:FecR family protein [Albitalea sp.]